MSVIDTLQILVEADARGIEQTMKKVIQTATGAVDAINKQEVDWTSIFSRSVTPAIVSGVASMFAFAIAQSVQFQQALNTTGTAAGQSTDQIAKVGASAQALSEQVPSSAQDIANSMFQVSSVFSDVADQQSIVTAMAQLAASGFGSLSDITAIATDVFKQFGVTTSAEGIQVLTSLMHAAEVAKESIPGLASQFRSFSDQLPAADKSVSSFNGLIATFGAEIKNLGLGGAESIFSALAGSANTAVGPMELLGTSSSKVQKSLLSDGGLAAIKSTSEALAKMGPGASLVATSFGLSATQVGQFQTNASKLPQITTDTANILKNTQSIPDAYNQAYSALDALTTLWSHVKKDFTDVSFADKLKNLFTDLNSGLSELEVGFDSFQKHVIALMGLLGGDTSKMTADQLLSLPKGASTGALSGNISGLSGSVLDRLNQSSSQSGLVSALTVALQSSGKGGTSTSYNTNTFNLSIPAGATGITSKSVADLLYGGLQGTNK